jgi:predicted dinucleotide-binding enzyme
VKRAGIVVIAVPWAGVEESVKSLGKIPGKIVIDVTNPLDFRGGRDVEVAVPHSGAELIGTWLPGAHMVKALNTLSWTTIKDPKQAGGPVSVPLASDDANAKQRVTRLVAQLGLEPFDAGRLANARYLEGMALLYVNVQIQDPPRHFEYYLRPR